jgi:phage terminase large subunit-like protein
MSGGLGREFNIANHSAGSFFRPISKDAGKTGSGPRPHFALCDEVHEHPDRSIMEMLERGFKFRQQPLLLMITNSGSDRHSVCWEEHEHAVRVAAGTRTPDDSFSYVGRCWTTRPSLSSAVSTRTMTRLRTRAAGSRPTRFWGPS